MSQDREADQRMLDRAPDPEPAREFQLPRRIARGHWLAAEWEDDPWRGNETEAAEMAKGPNFLRAVVTAEPKPAQGGLINKWTYTLDGCGHEEVRFLILSAEPHKRAACSTCKGLAKAQAPEDEQRAEHERMTSKGFGRETE